MKLIFIANQTFIVKELVKPAMPEPLNPEGFVGVCQTAMQQQKFVWVRDQDGTLQVFNPRNLITIEIEATE